LVAKRLGLLHELVPKAAVIAVLVDPNAQEIKLQAKTPRRRVAPSDGKSWS
jgi:hypothetical protein